MTTAYSGDGITFPDNSVQATAPRVGMVNRIINGDMRIDQRNAGASVTPSNTYTLDRWQGQNSQTSKYTVQQSSTAPAGFKTSLLVTSSSAYSVGSGDYFFLNQPIEAFNTSDLGFGTSGASTVTLSFWVRSSLTGIFGGTLRNYQVNRSYPFSYTISAANTWEQKSVTITGDTTGIWEGATNLVGIYVSFGLGSGSSFSGTTGSWIAGNLVSATGAVSVVGTSGATFYVTGVQLEKGSATDFEYVDYSQQLQMCQRYFQIYGGQPGGGPNFQGYGVGDMNSVYPFTTEMRVTPTSATSGNFQKSNSGDPVGVHTTTTATSIRVAVPTLGKFEAYPSGSSPIGKITFSAEL